MHRSLDLAQSPTARAQVWLAIGRAHEARYAFSSFHSAMLRAVEASEDSQSRADAPRLRLALARRDLDRVAALMDIAPLKLRPLQMWWDLDLAITRLDALAALGDTTGVDADAARVRGTCNLLDAVANRALAVMHRDRSLLLEAAADFDRMDLPAQAAHTRRLADRAGRRRR